MNPKETTTGMKPEDQHPTCTSALVKTVPKSMETFPEAHSTGADSRVLDGLTESPEKQDEEMKKTPPPNIKNTKVTSSSLSSVHEEDICDLLSGLNFSTVKKKNKQQQIRKKAMKAAKKKYMEQKKALSIAKKRYIEQKKEYQAKQAIKSSKDEKRQPSRKMREHKANEAAEGSGSATTSGLVTTPNLSTRRIKKAKKAQSNPKKSESDPEKESHSKPSPSKTIQSDKTVAVSEEEMTYEPPLKVRIVLIKNLNEHGSSSINASNTAQIKSKKMNMLKQTAKSTRMKSRDPEKVYNFTSINVKQKILFSSISDEKLNDSTSKVTVDDMGELGQPPRPSSAPVTTEGVFMESQQKE